MIPEWLEKRYKILWDTFQGSPFRFEAAAKILKEKIHDDKKQINVILSELRKKGWLKVKMDTVDARKKIYTLKSKEDILTETFPLKKNSLTRGELESLLKGAADLIRTRVDYIKKLWKTASVKLKHRGKLKILCIMILTPLKSFSGKISANNRPVFRKTSPKP